MGELQPRAHERAAEEFARRAKESLGESIHELILYGSTVRGETRGRDSDVDMFAVLEERGDADELREIAYDVTLKYGVVLSLFIESKDRFKAERNHPFVKNVLREGRSYV